MNLFEIQSMAKALINDQLLIMIDMENIGYYRLRTMGPTTTTAFSKTTAASATTAPSGRPLGTYLRAW